MKKTVMSVTATAVIATSLAMHTDAEAASYKVKKGDSLWNIAQQYHTSVAVLKSINDLNSTIIYPDQMIQTSKGSSSSASPSSSSSSSDSQSSGAKNMSTYTVKSGDTLSGIAAEHHISLQDLMDWNNISSSLIHPGDVFKVSQPETSSDSSETEPVHPDTPESTDSSSSAYTVKSGDTLSYIAQKHNVSVGDLKQWNNLSSDLILVGQSLTLNGTTSESDDSTSNSGSSNSSASNDDGASNIEQTSAHADYNVNSLISDAKEQVGTGYAWGGASPSGFDCSGFIHYIYTKAGKDIRRTSSDGYYNRSFYVNAPKKGDLVFFEDTYESGISHMGIYIGNNEFIHASSDGVMISNLDNPYWSKHFDSYKRFF